MSAPVLLYIVDVFAEERYSGNQLAVFRHAQHLTTEQMRLLAREMNFSESTFIVDEWRAAESFPVRIFTPATELPFAGHPTLGTAFVIQQEVLAGECVPQVNLELSVGRIPVRFEYGEEGPERLWMRQNSPVFGPVVERELVQRALGLAGSELAPLPAEVVSTGLPFIIAPLASRAALSKARLTSDQRLLKRLPLMAFLLFCPETRSPANQLSVRVFAHQYGVPEDPATGSANGCLAAYLVRHRYFGTDAIDIRVEQGHEVGRPSLLLLRSRREGETMRVEVGGKVIMVANGELLERSG
ncbi:MAG: PhzF family phenazine biosynthesis protein [bacterium]|jgi:trans-2,3-dihydro-3-hydroxyanthranilate isomerase|nr:PhzF family phenazine biosynthesis protein [candidate division KSB1 bacterium]MDH7560768.1 PhzF family phenazine biosynthesis protein [bacterium]